MNSKNYGQLLNESQLAEVCGGFHINIGTAIAGLVVGFITGGPVGLGYAIGGFLISEGVNNMADLHGGQNK